MILKGIPKEIRIRILALLLIAAAAGGAASMGLFDWREILRWAASHRNDWWIITVLVLLPALLFTFALPGTLFFWPVALIYPPLKATLILTAGCTLGALGGYVASHSLSAPWLGRLRGHRLYAFMEGHGDFLSQCTLRALPGFPQAIVNYSAGILRLPMIPFAAAAAVGVAAKTCLYTKALSSALSASDATALLDTGTLLPLSLLVLLLILARTIRRRMERH